MRNSIENEEFREGVKRYSEIYCNNESKRIPYLRFFTVLNVGDIYYCFRDEECTLLVCVVDYANKKLFNYLYYNECYNITDYRRICKIAEENNLTLVTCRYMKGRK